MRPSRTGSCRISSPAMLNVGPMSSLQVLSHGRRQEGSPIAKDFNISNTRVLRDSQAGLPFAEDTQQAGTEWQRSFEAFGNLGNSQPHTGTDKYDSLPSLQGDYPSIPPFDDMSLSFDLISDDVFGPDVSPHMDAIDYANMPLDDRQGTVISLPSSYKADHGGKRYHFMNYAVPRTGRAETHQQHPEQQTLPYRLPARLSYQRAWEDSQHGSVQDASHTFNETRSKSNEAPGYDAAPPPPCRRMPAMPVTMTPQKPPSGHASSSSAAWTSWAPSRLGFAQQLNNRLCGVKLEEVQSEERVYPVADEVPNSPASEDMQALPSVGSRAHFSGKCKPCAFSWRPEGCSNGVACTFCHLCDSMEKKRRLQHKKLALRVKRAARATRAAQPLNGMTSSDL
eukprot:TRINITY_DN96163_c0_g1_i1.p1 TRINITY_DN96163_c0_g1~~TRINITY_DN96163_c0_g1_i1.p1  ORF type:complete len:395 (+),score=48.26 TRINITY_DN96163_c0_g1_i1:164-1348(+)